MDEDIKEQEGRKIASHSLPLLMVSIWADMLEKLIQFSSFESLGISFKSHVRLNNIKVNKFYIFKSTTNNKINLQYVLSYLEI